MEPLQNKTWDLSLYELHRLPQEAITNNTEIVSIIHFSADLHFFFVCAALFSDKNADRRFWVVLLTIYCIANIRELHIIIDLWTRDLLIDRE
jgi:hypothetical protein